MDMYQLGKDIQGILSRLQAIEEKLNDPEGANRIGWEQPEVSLQAAKVEGDSSIAAERRTSIQYTWDRFELSPIEINFTTLTVWSSGHWEVDCPTHNMSRHSNWNVYHTILFGGEGTPNELYRILTWSGRFGAGYSETKRAGGHDARIQQHWDGIDRAVIGFYQHLYIRRT
jgi:hypothetical protein